MFYLLYSDAAQLCATTEFGLMVRWCDGAMAFSARTVSLCLLNLWNEAYVSHIQLYMQYIFRLPSLILHKNTRISRWHIFQNKYYILLAYFCINVFSLNSNMKISWNHRRLLASFLRKFVRWRIWIGRPLKCPSASTTTTATTNSQHRIVSKAFPYSFRYACVH